MISALRKQRTLAQTAHVRGFGYWSGLDVNVHFRPASPGTGIVFVRSDLPGQPRIPARIEHRIEIPRRTTLAVDNATVEMVEHVNAALAGMQIDNCEVWVDQAEMPGCDGSSIGFVRALQAAGIIEQDATRPTLVVTQPVRVQRGDAYLEVHPNPSGEASIQYQLEYGDHPIIGRQKIQLTLTPETFVDELASARTFLLEHEAQWLRQQGLGTRVTYQDLLIFDNQGPVENTLRYPDECVRHKTLDVVGDLALAGCDLIGRFVAHRSGHRLNAELVGQLLAQESVAEGLRKTA